MAKHNFMHYPVVGLFVLLILILGIQPVLLKQLYSSLLGRVVLIMIVLFFAMNNLTLGLLAALIIIITSNMYFVEGLENMDNTSTSVPEVSPIEEKKKESDKIESVMSSPTTDASGFDLETIKQSIQSKDSSTLPVSPSMTSSTENVEPSSKESFQSMFQAY